MPWSDGAANGDAAAGAPGAVPEDGEAKPAGGVRNDAGSPGRGGRLGSSSSGRLSEPFPPADAFGGAAGGADGAAQSKLGGGGGGGGAPAPGKFVRLLRGDVPCGGSTVPNNPGGGVGVAVIGSGAVGADEGFSPAAAEGELALDAGTAAGPPGLPPTGNSDLSR